MCLKNSDTYDIFKYLPTNLDSCGKLVRRIVNDSLVFGYKIGLLDLIKQLHQLSLFSSQPLDHDL